MYSKYLDYTFRCAAFRDEIYAFEEKMLPCGNQSTWSSTPKDSAHNDCHTATLSGMMTDDERNGIHRTESRLVFNTGLTSRTSGRTVYLLLTPNQKKSVLQAWRVNYGDPFHRSNPSFVTAAWLLEHVVPGHDKDRLPKQFELNRELFVQIRHRFMKNKLQIEADFEHIVMKYWDRIIGEYNKRMFCVGSLYMDRWFVCVVCLCRFLAECADQGGDDEAAARGV